MFLTQSNQIRNLSKREYEILRELCWFSKNLYNVALYNIRQHYFAEKQFLRYESNYHACKTNENYKLLQAGVSQQTLKVVDRSFRSFFSLIKKAKSGEYRFHDVKLPHYLKKDGMFPLIFSTNAITIKDGYFIVPFSREYAKLNPDVKIRIPFPARLADKKIKEVRIIPKYNGKIFDIQYVYESESEIKKLDQSKALSIDIGLENLATCVCSSTGASFIMDGRKLKSINQFYNKRKARLQSIADKQNTKSTRQVVKLTNKRNNQTKDYINKTSRHIINYCIENDIGTVIVGYNPDFKRGINLGKKNNQSFTQISFGRLRENLENLCERYGVRYVMQEESYTSKASFLDDDNIPVFNPAEENSHIFSGKRIKRGLYRSAKGILLNADINGALNILRKSKQKFDKEQLCKGLLASPQRIRIV